MYIKVGLLFDSNKLSFGFEFMYLSLAVIETVEMLWNVEMLKSSSFQYSINKAYGRIQIWFKPKIASYNNIQNLDLAFQQFLNYNLTYTKLLINFLIYIYYA